MPSDAVLSSLPYIKEQVGAFTIPGPHHRDSGSQDTFWPSTASGESTLTALSVRDFAQNGRLYLLADGVSLCADGQVASQIAVETAGNYYYQTAGAYPNTDQGRMQRLEDAAWQAHLRVSSWDERFFCWRAEAHPDGVAHHFKREQLKSIKPALCPLCNLPVVGLQTTFLAALVRGQQLMIVGVGDCSAFRLPANPEHGVEWVFPPEDSRFCGMASLSRESITGQSFIMTPGDSILLASDGMVKVLNGLHADANWHHMLRERLSDDYTTQVREMLLDLDGWRLSKPRQRRLHDDLTLLAVRLASENALVQQNNLVIQQYDQLIAKQQQGALPPADYRNFLQSAETALISDADPQNWQLYATALHHFALADLAAAKHIADEKYSVQLKSAAVIGRRGTEWVTVWRRLAQLVEPKKLADASADTHTQITSDLYSADWQSAPGSLIERVRAITVQAIKSIPNANAYISFLTYLDSVKVNERSLLPARSAIVVTTTEEENARALELQVTQAIADGKWEEAQELITELNKLKGATLNFDTEGVDTSPTRPVRQSRPTATRQTKAAARVVPTKQGRSELVMPFNHVQRVFHSREPNALLRDASHAAFSLKSEHFDLSMAADLLKEAGKLYPLSAVMLQEWKALWDNPNAEFKLVTSAESSLTFDRLAEALAIARDLALTIEQAYTTDATTLLKAEAKKQQPFVIQWEVIASDHDLLPYRLGRGAWWQANSLIEARLLLPQSRDNGKQAEQSAEHDYASGTWQAMQSQAAFNDRDSELKKTAIDVLSKAITSKEHPWSAAADTLQTALTHDSVIVRAFHIDQITSVDDADQDAQQRLRQLKTHMIGAAWEYTIALAEGRYPIKREQLERDRAALATAAFDVTQLDTPHATRLTTIYDLITYLINDADGSIVNGFYAYELKASKRLSEADFQRMSLLREQKISASWSETLAIAGLKEPYYLPPSGKGIGRIKPDKATSEGRRLQAVRGLLPHLSQSYDNWIEYAAFIYQWQPPLPLSAEDQQPLDNLVDTVIGKAWNSTLAAIRGEVVQNLGVNQLSSLIETYATLKSADSSTLSTTRMKAIRTLLPLMLQMRDRNQTHVTRALMARALFQQLASTLAETDSLALDAACDMPVETMWQFAVETARNSLGNSTDGQALDAIQAELDALDGAATIPDDKATIWSATEHLLHVAVKRIQHDGVLSADVSQELFRAFETLNIDDTPDGERRNRDLYDLSYLQLVEWKDSLPVQPGLLQKRRINAEKRRIQEYWLIRKEYGM